MRRREAVHPSVVIIGAGPNGLCAAAFLRAAGAKVAIFGKPMESWKDKMADGMLLRSTSDSSGFATPTPGLSVEQFEKETGIHFDHHPPIHQFIRYGEWYQQKGVPDVDPARVCLVKPNADGFITEVEDGRSLHSNAVVIATGITPFPHIPEAFAGISRRLASHVSEHTSFAPFRGKSVIVVGKGQSALESAALLHESGAQVEILTRGSRVVFIGRTERRGLRKLITSLPGVHSFLYPPTDLAGPPNNWAIADPKLFMSLSQKEKDFLFDLIGPIGSGYLEPRLAKVPITTRVIVKAAYAEDHKICLELTDGSTREADHVILGTGYGPSIEQLDLLSEDLKASIARSGGYPRLTLGYESVSVKGLYFVGSLAVGSLGPVNRFICGTFPVAQYLTESITGSKIGYPDRRTQLYVLGRRILYRLWQVYKRFF